jgi:hypothetical protein
MVEVEILEVDAHEFGSRCGDDAVHETFGCGEVGRFGRHVAWVVDAISSSSDAYAAAFGFSFLGSISNNDTAVGNVFLAVFWDIIVKDNFTCFGTLGSFGGVCVAL